METNEKSVLAKPVRKPRKKYVSKVDLLLEEMRALRIKVDSLEAEKSKPITLSDPVEPATKPLLTKMPTENVGTERIFVSPTMTINGQSYAGWCEVPVKIVSALQNMMDQYEKGSRRVSQFVDHGTKNLGSV